MRKRPSPKESPTLEISDPTPTQGFIRHSKTSTKTTKFWHRINIWWLWEIFGWFISTGCLSAIVGILIKYHGQPLARWPYSITLNSLLALLSAIAKSALLIPIAAGISQLKWTRFNQQRSLLDLQKFDDASRGPMGSILLLFGNGWLAFVGTLITIAALAFEPFIQQIVSYSARTVNSTLGLASVPRTNAYSVETMTANGGGAASPDIAADLKAAVYTGVYGNGSQVQPVCTSGNCTWPSFDSLAVCSSCADVTQYITISDFTVGEINPTKNVTCNMTLPITGLIPYTIYVLDTYQREVHLAYDYLSYVKMTLTMEPGVTGFVDQHNTINSSITSFTTIYHTDGETSDCSLENGRVTATECVLYWCVKTFSSEVESTVFKETSSSPRSMIQNTTQTWRAYYLNNGGVQYDVSRGYGYGGLGTEDFMSNTIFPAGNTTIKGYVNPGGSNDIVSILSNVAFDNWSTNQTVGARHGTDGILDFMTRITDSMSTNIRSQNITSDPVIGTALEQETFINVRWPWLILPILLVILTLFFLLSVILSTIRSKTEVWKSSQMVTIFHGFTHWELIDVDKSEGTIDMEEIAKTIQARLVPGIDGKRLAKME